ncbi:hypothetical protein RHMOL_Rhmol06G0093900 [Rhododendron molle]|uniref:Uncharacterized protein n=1 Tax=Rhododendron molle TaxID=49168 RepID=A0ACC0NAJ3_RHOML|nr:hypothetical protein RHMOL_Rhmol06G0093900 [Rhododendron molle]
MEEDQVRERERGEDSGERERERERERSLERIVEFGEDSDEGNMWGQKRSMFDVGERPSSGGAVGKVIAKLGWLGLGLGLGLLPRFRFVLFR